MKFALACLSLSLCAPLSLAVSAQDATPDVAAPARPDDTDAPSRIVLVEVDGRTYTLADAMEVFTSSHTGHGVLVRGDGPLRELVGRLVERELFLAEADALGLYQDPELLASMDDYLRQQVVREFWKRELTDKIRVPEEDVEAFYAKTDVALKLTLIETRDRAACEALRVRVVAGEDMAELATRESTHASRSFGGLLPYVRRGEIDSGLEKDVFALETPGSLTPVLPTEHGFAFARLEERSVNPTRLPREVALPPIRKILRDRAEDALRAEVEARLVQSGGVSFDEALLLPKAVLDEAPADAVVARVKAQSLSMGELRDALNLESLRGQEPETAQGAARYVARDWAFRQVIWNDSEANGLRADADIVQRVERQRHELILGLLGERYVFAEVKVTEEDLRKSYEENKETAYTQPAERRLAYIVVGTKEEADQILARYTGGETFEALAKQVSIDKTSAAHGGRIGWVKKGDILPEVEAVAFSIAKSAVAGPLETSSGWFLVKVLDVKDAELIPFSAARNAVQKRLTKERQKGAWLKWASRLRERAVVTIDENGMRAAVEWLERQAKPASKPLDPNSPHAPASATELGEKKG